MSEEDKEAPRYQVVDWSPAGDSSTSLMPRARNGSAGSSGTTRRRSSSKNWSRIRAALLELPGVARRPHDRLQLGGRQQAGRSLRRRRRHEEHPAAHGCQPAAREQAFGEDRVDHLPRCRRQQDRTACSTTRSDYEPGKKYPTVFNVYEQFFDDNFNGTINVLASNGYAVMQPSVSARTGLPRRSLGQGRNLRGQQADRDGRGRPRAAWGCRAPATAGTRRIC